MNIVSIPHRYGKNWKIIYIGLEMMKEFPFLIGTVRTFILSRNRDDYMRFHSS